jgi:hypothetical protein
VGTISIKARSTDKFVLLRQMTTGVEHGSCIRIAFINMVSAMGALHGGQLEQALAIARESVELSGRSAVEPVSPLRHRLRSGGV